MKRALVFAIVIVAVLAAAGAAFAQDKPKETPKIDISGTWDFAVESPQGTMNLTSTFKQDGEKLTGIQSSQMGEMALEGTIKGADIAFAIVLDMQGQQMTITYTGKVDGETMSGTIEFGSFGSATWTAKKQPKK
jgi:hypothetical protein